MRDEPKKIARMILKEGFSFDYDAFARAEAEFTDTGASGDEEGFKYWQSVFKEVMNLWSEGDGARDMEQYHMIMTVAMFAEGVRPYSDEKLEEIQEMLEKYQETHCRNQSEEREEFDDNIPF